MLSAGHGSMLQYALHYLLGYEDMPIEELQRFRQLGSRTAGHPEYGHALGIETTTGPLGQGIATAVGMALAERMLAARFGADLVDHYTYVIAGDGCLQEGISHEAIDLAGHLRLSRLIVFWDDNSISIDGPTSLVDLDGPAGALRGRRLACAARSTATTWKPSPRRSRRAQQSDRPSLIACRTMIGKGAPNLGGSEKTHGAPLGDAEIAATRENIGWPHAPFEVPDDILAAWREVAERGSDAPPAPGSSGSPASPQRASLRRPRSPASCPAAVFEALAAFRKEHVEKATKVATRKASRNGARRDQRRDRPDRRRLGRPDPLEPDHHQGHGPRRAWRLSPAATSTTASASTAWRRR